jgi:nicotinate-nucleotide adenylyltransferase
VRLGLFGGTFDPPHTGHLIVAQDAHSALELDRVIFVPARVPPHKRAQEITAASLRLEMLEAAIAGNPHFAVDDLELKREGPSYTVDTLRALHGRDPDAELFLLMGADQYADLSTWHEAEAIPRLAHVVVLARQGEKPPHDVTAADVTRIDISATEIRRRVAAGRPIRYLVPEAVEAVIRRERLYLTGGR